MTYSNLITTYLGNGLASGRPASPSVPSIAFYWATDTTALSMWNGSAWVATATIVGLGNVTNDVQTKAAIVPNTAPAAGKILVGNAGGTAYAPVSVSGDATLTETGALTVKTTNPTKRTVSASTGSKTVTSEDAVIFLDGSEGPFTMTYPKALTNVVEFWLDGVGITPVNIEDDASPTPNIIILMNAGQAFARVVGDGTKMHAGYVQ